MIPRLMVSVSIMVVAIVALATIGTVPVPSIASVTLTQESFYEVRNVVPYTWTSVWGYPIETARILCATIIPGMPPEVMCVTFPSQVTVSQLYTTSVKGYTTQEETQMTTVPVTESFSSVVPVFQALGLDAPTFAVLGIIVIAILAVATIRIARTKQPETTEDNKAEPEAKKATSRKQRMQEVVQVPTASSINCKVCGKPMRLLDKDEQRWYCNEDDQLYYAKDQRWVEEKTGPKKAESKTEKPPPSKNFCIECGNTLPRKSKFCNNCGTKQP